jgi:hypothetical protein
MSAFDTTSTETSSEQTDWVAKVKELKGENFVDPQVMAKSLIESNQHIDRIEAENVEYKTRVEQQDAQKNWADEVISKMNQRQPASGEGASQQTSSTSEPTNQGPSEDDVKSLIEQTITERDRKRTAAQNLEEVDSKLNELFGTEAADKVVERAKEMGMTVQRLQSMAEESPNAFFTLMGAQVQKETNSVGVSNSVNSASFNQNSGTHNWAYFQKMRVENPKLYRSSGVQNELLAQRKKLGDDFYR